MATHYSALPQNNPPTLVGVNYVFASFNIATGTPGAVGFIVNDTIDFFEIPNGATVFWFDIDFPILDTNVSPLAAIELGTDLSVANGGVDVGGFLATATNLGTHFSTAVVASKLSAGYVQASLPFYYEAKLFGPGGNVQQQLAKLRLTFTAAPATSAVAGVIWATMGYTMTSDAGIFNLKNL